MKTFYTRIILIGTFLILTNSLFSQISITFNTTDCLCYGDCNGSIDIDLVSGGVPPYTYLWSNGDTAQSINNLCAGSYSVTVTDDVDSTQTDYTYINQPDFVEIIIDVTEDTIQVGDSDSIMIVATGGNGSQYICFINGVVFDINYTYVVYPILSTTYCAYCSDTVGCLSSCECITIVVDSLSGLDQNISYYSHHICYPNPTTGKITITADNINRIEVLDIHGREVYTGRNNTIDLSQQPQGIYIIKATTDKQTITKKIIKQ